MQAGTKCCSVVALLRGTECYREAQRGRERKKNMVEKIVEETERQWYVEESEREYKALDERGRDLRGLEEERRKRK